MRDPTERPYDTVIVGSGFGGSLIAHALVRAGQRVLLVERGDWVERGPQNWGPRGAFLVGPHYSLETPYDVFQGRRRQRHGSCSCVGGLSVFYGGASFRFREEDFDPAPEIEGDSGARWPIGYADMEPYYTWAERILGVMGRAGEDPTEPPRSAPFPAAPGELPAASARIAAAARDLGMKPFRIPLAIDGGPGGACRRCTTCDTYACAVGAKNDLATRVIPDLLERGMDLLTGTVATHLVERNGRVAEVVCYDRARHRHLRLRGDNVVVAGGALATPHLLLASGLERLNPGGQAVGRYLLRHCNAMVYGLFADRPDPAGEHHKQIAIQDFYFGDDARGAPGGKLGNIQQVMAPPAELVRTLLPAPVGGPVSLMLSHITGLIVIAEDQPRAQNRVEVDLTRRDAFGLPRLRVHHRYTPRDALARRALARRAKAVLRRAGALVRVAWPVPSFSHAGGTVRMGSDPSSSPLDERCRFRGVENLYVADASALPRLAGLNPSLTIAANALRVGEAIAGPVERDSVAAHATRPHLTPLTGARSSSAE